MNELTAKRDYEQAARLRQATFELLEHHTRRGRQDSDQHVITALQDAANRLGAAEQYLLESCSPTRNDRSFPNRQPQASSNDAPHKLPISRATAVILALAETLVPLAPSRADEAERWLRIMREYGHVGNALEELGMVSGELSTPADEPRQPDPNRADPVSIVADDAVRFATDRNAPAVSTVDLLFAVILHYGSLFDRALYSATSKTRNDLLATLDQPARIA